VIGTTVRSSASHAVGSALLSGQMVWEAPHRTGNRPPVCVRTRRRLKTSARRIVNR
jgi:hypothetical protein